MGDVSEEDWSEFELYSDGDYCASASGKRTAAWAEILHYMTIYAQDGGEMTVQEIIRNTVNVQLEPPPKAAKPIPDRGEAEALRVFSKWAIDVSTLGELGDLERRLTAAGVSLTQVGEWAGTTNPETRNHE